MTYEAIGSFMGQNVQEHEKKDKSAKFWAGQVMLELDNSWEKRTGEKVEKKTVMPFKVFGATATTAQTLKFGDKVKVVFELEGREYQGKHYGDAKAIFLSLESVDEIPFGNESREVPSAGDKMPWEN